jgi:hypothetical protein
MIIGKKHVRKAKGIKTIAAITRINPIIVRSSMFPTLLTPFYLPPMFN